VNSLIEFIKTMGAARLAAMGAVTALLIGFFTVVIMRISTPAMAPLFTELSLDDSARIAKDLDAQGIGFELRAEGSTILVPKADVTRLRMKLAETGMPRGGSVGYEIFDKSDTLGTTSFVQNVNHLRALEGELARTIRSIDRVSSARVHLVIPERQLFARDKQDPSAAIVLKLRGTLDASQVRAIRHLTASAVRGLKPERISIVDERGKLLADGSGNEADPVANGLDDRHAAFEKRLRDQVESIVSNIVGPGRARVQVAAEVDYSRIQQTSDTFDPESKVARSTQTREESTGTTSNEQGVTVGNEVPPVAQRGAAVPQTPAPAQRDQSKKTEETVNYEISRTTRSETTEAGRVKRISVAVLVDGSYAKADKGEMTYQPRSKEEIERITALVKSAIGFEQKRGDQVEVVNLRFADSPVVPVTAEEGGFFSMLRFTTDDIFQGVQILVIVVLSGLVLLFVIRPLVRRIVTPDESVPALAPVPAPVAAPVIPEAPLLSPDNPAARLIEVAKIQGEVQAQSIQKVGELADRNPHETVSIIRQWMHETKV
jgi:flagellar M-ring protein FliF